MYKLYIDFLFKRGFLGYVVIFNIMRVKGIFIECLWLVLYKLFCIYSKLSLFKDKNLFIKVIFINFSKCGSLSDVYSILD